MWCQYATEYYSALKKKEILTDAATWVKLEGVINEISQPQKDKIVYDSSSMRYPEEPNS